MTTAILDTLQIAKKAKEAGFSEKQAEFYAENLAELVDSQVATKQDIKDLRYELKEFMVKVAIGIVSIIGGLQTLFHFVK